MLVRNVHERRFVAPPERVGELLDSLGSPHDLLWPRDRWPRMKFDRPLAIGAAGGHGPIRYTVEAYEPRCSVRFRFTSPPGFDGTHAFIVDATAANATLLRHELVMKTRGTARITWPVIFRPLHDALIEDALDRAAVALGEPPRAVAFTPWVRALRAVLRRRRASAASTARR